LLVADGCALLPGAASCCHYPNEPDPVRQAPVGHSLMADG